MSTEASFVSRSKTGPASRDQTVLYQTILLRPNPSLVGLLSQLDPSRHRHSPGPAGCLCSLSVGRNEWRITGHSMAGSHLPELLRVGAGRAREPMCAMSSTPASVTTICCRRIFVGSRSALRQLRCWHICPVSLASVVSKAANLSSRCSKSLAVWIRRDHRRCPL
ncbi:uncharacterized protein LY79DRAFT_301816 [Colletotrichum navitas]|uniref:Uncharacterized protein n=1 Tax=Colletotrichum navitas TaxID=681940 RepID=A0AAD8V276_9PEZI|nr:uncharacterized protein LY79DRAFT_301816 [Colletotrichum navitas]KAK1580492.1 hypothetical protein LY79DRAFT_301816 [Colletotrichum navitas]